MTKQKDEIVTVVIPTYNRKDKLIRCIDSVIANDYKHKYIIVTDDASTDGTHIAIKKYKKRKDFLYLRNKKESLLSVTINNALLHSKGEYIFIVDDDNVLEKDCISNLVSSFKKYKEAGIVGPLALYKSHPNIIMHAGTVKSKFMRRAIFLYMNEEWKGQIKEGEEVEEFANAFMFKRKLIYEVGMWDLSVPFMGEDGNFEARVRKKGYKIIINPKAVTYHEVPYLPKERYFIRVNKLRMYYVMRSKIINEFRYDTSLGKLTFFISIPLYIAYYMMVIFKSENSLKEKFNLLKSLFSGIIDGFIVVILNKSEIVWPTKG